jgi:hypothetical protein
MATPYSAIRMALISARERFKQMAEKPFTSSPSAYANWAKENALDGFREVDAALANPDNFEQNGPQSNG